MIIACKSIRGYLQAISGVFITPENPGGLTPKELTILATLVYVMNQRQETIVSPETRQEVARMTNHPVQVITNYINKLKEKRVFVDNLALNQIILSPQVIFQRPV